MGIVVTKNLLFLICSLYVLPVLGQNVKDSLSGEPRGIRVVNTPEGSFRLWVDGFVHLDGSVFMGYYADYNPIPGRGTVRRARLGLKTQIARDWFGEFQVDFSQLKPRITEAYITYSGIRNLEIEAGHFENLFSMEAAVLPRDLPFMERPMVVQLMAPPEMMGIQFRTRLYWFLGAAGVSFDKTRYPQEDSASFTTAFDARSVCVKAVAMPFVNRDDLGLHIGLGASYRIRIKDPVTGSYPFARYNPENLASLNRNRYLDTYEIRNVREQFLFNGEFAAYYKGWRVQAEYIHNMLQLGVPLTGTQGPVSTLHFNGWYAQTGIMLFGGRQHYDTQTGSFLSPYRGRKWGDLEILVRYDYLNLNFDPVTGGAVQNYTAGITYHVNENVKFLVNYMYTDNDRYANGNGQFYIGHDAYGYPSTDYSVIVEPARRAGVDYHSVSLRFEITF